MKPETKALLDEAARIGRECFGREWDRSLDNGWLVDDMRRVLPALVAAMRSAEARAEAAEATAEERKPVMFLRCGACGGLTDKHLVTCQFYR